MNLGHAGQADRGFLLLVRPAAREELGNMEDTRAGGRHPHPEIVIHYIVQVGAKPTSGALPDIAAEEDFGLIEEVSQQPEAIHFQQQSERQRELYAERQFIVMVQNELVTRKTDHTAAAGHHINAGSGKSLRHAEQRPGLEQIVAVDPGQDIARRPCKSLVQSI